MAGRPLVVLVSTEWCPPCRTMKKTVIPQIRKRGLLEKVAFAIVNPDHDRRLARRLTGGVASIPQLLMFRKTPNGWRRRRLVGGQSTQTVEKFIKQGVALDEATKRAAADGPQAKQNGSKKGGSNKPHTEPVSRR